MGLPSMVKTTPVMSVDGAGGAVVAGDPLGGDEGGGAGLDGEIDLGVVELAGSLGEVGGDADGARAPSWHTACRHAPAERQTRERGWRWMRNGVMGSAWSVTSLGQLILMVAHSRA
jgi:hypothetical protein